MNDAREVSVTFHDLAYDDVLEKVQSSTEGLSSEEATQRLSKYGRNEFSPERQVTWFERIASQLLSPLAFVLVVACGITLALQEFVDTFVIAFALCIAVVVGVIQEGKASSAFSKLASSQEKKATVIRDGAQHEVDARNLVPGDVVVLRGGARVPADVRLFEVKKLSTNEAALTGEWAAVKKSTEKVMPGTALAEQTSMAWMGTFISEGYGKGVVVRTGDETEVGQLASSMRDVEESDTPLQAEMKTLSKIMLYIVGALVVGIFVIGIVQGQSLHDMLLMSIAIAVASVPEGLPAAVTIILAVGMEALLKRDGLVRSLLAAETLGSTTYVLTDKTGTLTEAKMKITECLLPQREKVLSKNFTTEKVVEQMTNYALVAADAYVDETEDTKELRGDPVERSIVALADTLSLLGENGWRNKRSDYLAFTSEARFAAGLVEVEGEQLLCVNGAPETLLEAATHALSGDGTTSFTDEQKEAVVRDIETATKAGKRLVAVGYKPVEYKEIPDEDDLLHDLIFAGVFVFDDPVREGVQKSIEGVQSAGATVLLITGDNKDTAHSIAVAVGIASEESRTLTGEDLEAMSDEELLEALTDTRVFARVLPKQKMRIATVLQKKGEIVAMTGDGINDAPALRRANIGVAIGSGTEVAKEASDLVLLKDTFSTIYAAIEEGRRIVANLRKIVGYLLSTSLSEVVLIAAALLTGSAIPILPAQILWANVIEEGLMSVAFAFEKGDKNAMKRRPQDIHDNGLVSKDMLMFIAFTVTILGMINVALYFYLRQLGLAIEDLRSLMFLAISMDSLFISFAFRSLLEPVWRVPLSNNWFFVGSFVLSLGLFALVLTVPFFQFLLSYEPQPWSLIMLPVVASVVTLLVVEVGKWLFFFRESPK